MAGPFKMKGFSGFGNSPAKKTYKEAYAGLSEERKAKQSEADFIKEAKDWNIKKYGTTEPTREAKKLKPHYKDVTGVKSGKKKLEAIKTHKAKEKVRTDAETKAFREKQAISTKKHQKDIATKKEKSKTDVKGAKTRGKAEIQRTREVYGRGSAEVKAARKNKRQKVRKTRKARRAERKA